VPLFPVASGHVGKLSLKTERHMQFDTRQYFHFASGIEIFELFELFLTVPNLLLDCTIHGGGLDRVDAWREIGRSLFTPVDCLTLVSVTI
jgi:hypothetical protein